MKVQNFFRTNAVVIGFAAVLVLASSSRAQEIDNTTWADSSTVESFTQPAWAPVVTELGIAATTPVSADKAATTDQPSVLSASILSNGVSEGFLIGMSIMLVLMAPLGLLLFAKVRRAKQNGNTQAYPTKKSVALS
jgi:hypothetical protein